MWREPVKWDREASANREAWGEFVAEKDLAAPPHWARPRVFCASLADVFEDWGGKLHSSDGTGLGVVEDSPPHFRSMTLDDVRARLFGLIDKTPNLDWLLLTKRPENIRTMWPSECSTPTSVRPIIARKNVWLGTSIACQEDADRNIPELLKCRDLAAKLFVSVEPLVGSVKLGLDEYESPGFYEYRKHLIDWVIVGGESGPNARPCDVAWIRSIVQQCEEAGVPCFVKQLGARPIDLAAISRVPGHDRVIEGELSAEDVRVICKVIAAGTVALQDPKGGDPAEWPEDLRVREVPS
jgi:protein gp37